MARLPPALMRAAHPRWHGMVLVPVRAPHNTTVHCITNTWNAHLHALARPRLPARGGTRSAQAGLQSSGQGLAHCRVHLPLSLQQRHHFGAHQLGQQCRHLHGHCPQMGQGCLQQLHILLCRPMLSAAS